MNEKYRELTSEELEQVTGGTNKYFLDYNQNAELELNLAQPSGTDFWDSKSLVEKCPENPFAGGSEDGTKC